MPAKIDNQGNWCRRVKKRWKGRTDIFKSVLSSSRLRFCRYTFEGGPTVIIAADELRRVVQGGPSRYGGKIWGPFTIDPKNSTVEGNKIGMQIL